ncbi:putative aminopeptidase FrvX [Roseivirga pacifica]|uniref:Putative aminopeptidase FrvX n=1 Tax=Roseivirga pacifica TaxID=1267423 RepID=A0A1I0NFF3_9BACT|nr:M20/M25/M40 family metallo-hydrolase [Roseivirga pacifica]RKQ51136.1 putative aminopeptidase FrvX [Roseivirga pacifica]SEV99756.1 Putative aminopeptidase FrvX [Roseivirga pacifica]
MNFELLKTMCGIHAPSGNEGAMKEFLLAYIEKNKASWAVQPEVYHGDGFQDCIVLKFGTPRTAVFAHMDSIGFTVRYQNQLVAIGGPQAETGYVLTGEDALGPIECELLEDDGDLSYKFARGIQRGTDLVFKCDFRETEDYVQSCYLDNRLGVFNALKVAETLENGVIAFTCWEEHGGGSVPYIAKFISEKWGVHQALISDITWVTEGVVHGEGVAISMRDRNVPRRSFVNKIIQIAEASGVPYQLEVEGAGSSDGRELQVSPYPFDWCFIGAPEDNVHSPDEIVHKKDIVCMIELYQRLLEKL